MEERKDSMEFDPNRTPLTTPVPGMQYVQSPHGDNGKLLVNANTGQIQPMERIPGFPIDIPESLQGIDQPFVHTCSPEKKDHSGLWINRGCPAYNGCAIVQWYKTHRRPVNLIITKNGKVDSAPCFYVYVGTSASGRPTSQVGYHKDGWHVLTDRTTIPQKIRNPITNRWEEVETEVPNLAPFYEKVKKEKETSVAMMTPKRRGRPRKTKDEPVAVNE